MKVAQVICTFPPYRGGMGNSVFNFSRELALLGHEITVFTPRYRDKPACGSTGYPGFHVESLTPALSHGNAAVLPQVLRAMKACDIVHLHYPFFGTAEMVALNRLLHPTTRLVLHYHMDNKASGARGLAFGFYRHTVLPILLALAEVVVCSSLDYISHSEAGWFYRRHPERFFEVPYGVDAELFKPGAEAPRGKEVLFVGALITQNHFKGVENLLRAFVEVRERVEGSRLRIVGRGDMEGHYRDLSRRLGIAPDVTFVNDADDAMLAAAYRECSLAVLPSTDMSEAFGLVLLEAMASGKPVVASALPGVRTVFEEGRQGLLVSPGDIKDLTDKLVRLLEDEEMSRRYGLAARKLVEEKYTWRGAGRSLDRIYRRGQR